MSNVIKFPKGKLNTPPQSMEELISSVEDTRKEHISYILDDIIPSLMQMLSFQGFHLDSEECEHTNVFMFEALESALYKAAGLEHWMHDIVSDIALDLEESEKTSISFTVDETETETEGEQP